MQMMAHQDGEIATAKGARQFGTIMTQSTISNKSVEEVSPHHNHLWFQLYFAKDKTITIDMLRKVVDLNFKAIVFTVDAPRLGTRERDERNKFKMPDHLKLGNLIGTKFESFDDYEGSSMNMHSDYLFDPSLTFETIQWIKDQTNLPVLVKGILRPDDAAQAMRSGADGIIISNHGGRQLDTAVPTLKQVAPIRNELGPDALIIVDGGIRRGIDIFKCIALGANAIQIGRPALWGLKYKGADGVHFVLDLLQKEFVETMVLTGCRCISDITNDLIKHKSQI